jgi:FKBP-type peptidyl-prolyl cis-trans isomerase
MSDIALAKGEKFLADNATKEGVTITASGLQYKVITPGTGKSPKATDVVEVHYEGTLINGNVFDSSYRRKESIEFPLNGVIAGWTEGVQLMQEGAKFRFYIPSKLAYGKAGSGSDIGPDETLIFDVELLKVR